MVDGAGRSRRVCGSEHHVPDGVANQRRVQSRADGGSLVDPDPTNDSVSLVVDGVSRSPGGGRWVAAGNIDGQPGAEIITGTDAGDLPQVRAFAGNGTDLGIRFLAFDRTFRGGVRVAACDVDGDGVDEVIVGQGVGGSRIRVLRVNGSSVAEMAAGLPFESTFTGGVFLSFLDIDRDGRAEVVVGAGVGRSADVKMFSVNGAQLVSLGGWTAYPNFMGGAPVDGPPSGKSAGGPLPGDDDPRAWTAGDGARVVGDKLAGDVCRAGRHAARFHTRSVHRDGGH